MPPADLWLEDFDSLDFEECFQVKTGHENLDEIFVLLL